MSTITTEQIKALRDATGISVMHCKKALEEAEGDMESAITILRKKGGAAALKKQDRTLGAGTIAAYVHAKGSVATLVEVQCETDFVSSNSEFKALAHDIAMQIAATSPKYIDIDEVAEEDKSNGEISADVLLMQPFIKNPEITVKEHIDTAVHKFGEKIRVARMTRYSVLG
ncbi:MAG: hypothetical protein A2928_01765 [Candidatus Taylorbacteria bacterium RIFCSPLOWO2_01_FULL_45_15b]|uniref:Elongation factor Ts n=1 Tax=Candidatus Taylorbacteria bacterium RIFCSPLOWO2_01_FULL_45_15b TaxID=1802319 RepID=A0A1G2NDY3_9BACT|nr:MAG: hypothetical protein A2928_01765 [Candidatus Taylorbacteria bacterium RIFCSPLOWO2_01_FULL_45_15b]